MLVAGIRLQSGGDSGCDTFPHFRCGGIGKCHDQQSVNIRRMFSVTDHADDTFHQHCRLTASRSRRYQNITVMQFDYPLLFRGEFHSHILPLFLILLSCRPTLPLSPASAASASAYPDPPAASSHIREYCRQSRRPFYRRNRYMLPHFLFRKDLPLFYRPGSPCQSGVSSYPHKQIPAASPPGLRFRFWN